MPARCSSLRIEMSSTHPACAALSTIRDRGQQACLHNTVPWQLTCAVCRYQGERHGVEILCSIGSHLFASLDVTALLRTRILQDRRRWGGGA